MRGLGTHLFSATKESAKTCMNTIIDNRPRPEREHLVLPLQQLDINHDLYSFKLDIGKEANVPAKAGGQ